MVDGIWIIIFGGCCIKNSLYNPEPITHTSDTIQLFPHISTFDGLYVYQSPYILAHYLYLILKQIGCLKLLYLVPDISESFI